jgi:hypothetical protein
MRTAKVIIKGRNGNALKIQNSKEKSQKIPCFDWILVKKTNFSSKNCFY